MDRAVLVRRRLDRLLGRHVVRNDEARHRALVERDAHRAVDEVADLRGDGRHVHVLVRDVLEERGQVDLLLVAAAERRHRLLADDRDDRLVVELRVVEPVQQVDRAGTGGGDADADLAGELRVPARHERGHLLVARLDELGIAVSAVERAEEGVDPVARIAVDAPDAPLAQPLQDVIGNQLAHVLLLSIRHRTPTLLPGPLG